MTRRVGIPKKTIKLVVGIATEAINVTAALVVLAPAIVVVIGAIVALFIHHSVTAARSDTERVARTLVAAAQMVCA